MIDSGPHREHRHRVRRRAWGVYAAASISLLLGALWLASQAVVCWNPRATLIEQLLCDWAFLLPDLSIIVAAGVAGLLLATLWHLGGETVRAGQGAGLQHHVHRTCAGYYALADTKVHVKASAALLMVTTCLFAWGALYTFFYVDAGRLLLGALLLAAALYLGTRTLVRSAPVRGTP